MKKGTPLAIIITLLTFALVAIGTLWPNSTAVYWSGGENLLRASSTPQAAVENLGDQIRLRHYGAAYSSLANKAEFTEQDFIYDLRGSHLSLRTFATLASFEVSPLHATADTAVVAMRLHWSTVVGGFEHTRVLHLVRNGNRWQVDWPLVKEKHVPPQVIPVNYLRWDVIYRGPGDDWGVQDVESPHVRIVDMHPVNRAAGAVVMGELLNEDVVPAFVSVRASLLAKDGSTIASATSFDMISHTLLPKQVTPFRIQFPNVDLSQVGSIRMTPLAVLVSASADPIVEVDNQKFNPAPGQSSLTGQLSNQSGQIVNVAHVLSTFYDQNGQVIWVAGQYVSRALLPQTPVPFRVPVPEDLAKEIKSERTIVATYSVGNHL